MDTPALQLVGQEHRAGIPGCVGLDIWQTSEFLPLFASTPIPFSFFSGILNLIGEKGSSWLSHAVF